MIININAYVEINPPPADIDYEFYFNGDEISHEIINEFQDEQTGGHIVECLLRATVAEPSVDNQLVLKANSIDAQAFIQIRELFIDDIKMDHVLLLISRLKTVGITEGTQLNKPGEIIVNFDMPVWAWWCEHLHSIEVVENQGWRIKQYE